jgi:hypothetical protein
VVTSDGTDEVAGDDAESEAAHRRKVVPFRRPRREPMEPATSTDQEMIERGRRVGGVAGAAMAGMMVALRDIYETPKRDDGAVVVDAPSEPHDAHRDGMQFEADEVGGDADVTIAAQERRDPVVAKRRRSTRRPTL